MRLRTGLGLLICCCLGMTACTAAAPKGPEAAVTTPSVGKPPPPASAQAALSSEAFTSYAGLGATADDGLAPGDTYQALHTACMNAAGYGQYADNAPYEVRENRGLAFAQPFGPWGYLGTALAAESGFMADAGPRPGPGGPPFSSLSAGAQEAGGKCLNIVMNFNNAQFAGSMAGVETMNNDIGTDMVRSIAVKNATTAWAACMAKNGYNSSDPNDLALNELDSLGLRAVGPGGPTTPTAAQTRAQIALAVADANCTATSDLAGIYFAIQASYEQQLVNANQQALNAEVRRYKAAFAEELSKLPALLRAASATPEFHGKPVGPGKSGSRPARPGAGTRDLMPSAAASHALLNLLAPQPSAS